jgi:hypothetical protein
MPDLYIDRLTVKLASGDAQSARRLAEEVSAALAHIPLTGTLSTETGCLRVNVNALGANHPGLANRIVAGIHSQLRRS